MKTITEERKKRMLKEQEMYGIPNLPFIEYIDENGELCMTPGYIPLVYPQEPKEEYDWEWDW
jgi:hypothetical protein